MSHFSRTYASITFCLLLGCCSVAVGQNDPFVPAQRAEAARAVGQAAARAAAAQIRLAQERAAVDDQTKAANERLLEELRLREQSFVTRVCKLNEEQKELIEKTGKELQAEAFKNIHNAPDSPVVVNGRMIMQAQVRIRMGNAVVVADKTSMTNLRKKLQEKYESLLTPEQAQIYKDEVTARKEFTRRANAECLVTILDQKLSLAPEQREPLLESLMGWEEADELQLSFYLQQSSENYVPPIPLKYYAKHLTQAQRGIFESSQQVGVQKNQYLDLDGNW